MITKFKLFESIDVDNIKFKSNITWFNRHPKIYSKEEEEDLLSDLSKHQEKLDRIEKYLKGDYNVITDEDPYGEENWGDEPEPVSRIDLEFKNSTIKLIDIIKERIKILRSFK